MKNNVLKREEVSNKIRTFLEYRRREGEDGRRDIQEEAVGRGGEYEQEEEGRRERGYHKRGTKRKIP